MKDTIKCELCNLECSMQVSASHLRVKHNMTTKEYRKLGYQTLSEARLHQLRSTPVAGGKLGAAGKFGKDHWNWKGGHTNGAGYRIVYHKGKRVVEHRVVAEQKLGRPLSPSEVVHHIDGNRSNNSPDNLQVMTQTEHNRIDIKHKLKRIFHTDKHCEEAAKVLRANGWSISKIGHALRVERRTVISWLESD